MLYIAPVSTASTSTTSIYLALLVEVTSISCNIEYTMIPASAPWLNQILWWHPHPGQTIYYTPWLDHILWWHHYPGRTIYYGDTHAQAGPYTMVTPTLRPDHISWWHQHPGWTIYHGDTHTLARPYSMVSPTPRPNHTPWWHPHSGWTIYYGDTHTQVWL